MEACPPPEKKQRVEETLPDDVEENVLTRLPDDVHRIISSFYHWRPPIFYWRIFWKYHPEYAQYAYGNPNPQFWQLGVDIEFDHGIVMKIPFRVFFILPFNNLTKKTILTGDHSWELELKKAGIFIIHQFHNHCWEVPSVVIPSAHPQYPEFLAELKFTIQDMQDPMSSIP